MRASNHRLERAVRRKLLRCMRLRWRPRMVRALWCLCSLRVAIGLSAGLVGACVELPGIYYDALFNERPSESDCVNLTDALTAKLNLQLQLSPYQCAVTLDNDGRKPSTKWGYFCAPSSATHHADRS